MYILYYNAVLFIRICWRFGSLTLILKNVDFQAAPAPAPATV